MHYSETILDNICEYLLHLHSSGTHLLRNETAGGHTGGGVDLKEHDLIARKDMSSRIIGQVGGLEDVIRTDDAFASEEFVNP